jgi:hypothetical protein
MSKFCLSDFVRPADTCVTSEADMILVDEIKEFIRQLKYISIGYDLDYHPHRKAFFQKIDKLAGDKLI